MKCLLVTGGCGFIGSNFIRHVIGTTDWRVVNLDKLTYAGNLDSTGDLDRRRLRFVLGDICDRALVERILLDEKPWAVVNFAAESHVDRSIIDASPFVTTNVAGVQALLDAVRNQPVERFLQVSTDEVYGDKEGKPPSTEDAPLLPSSPYAATKAAADMLCFSYHRTYGTPVIITRSSNNYGPYQFPEKLIPLLIRNGLAGLDLPIYGDGQQIRDWLYVEDNCRGILSVLQKGNIGSVYNLGTGEERSNQTVVEAVCHALAEQNGDDVTLLRQRIRSVADRPGHDRRYVLNSDKVRHAAGWSPQVEFAQGLARTVDWYLGHRDWMERVTSGDYRNYYDSVYLQAWSQKSS